VVGDAKKINWMINQILHNEDSSRGLREMNEALIREAAALSLRHEQQRQRSDDLARALEARDALIGTVARWLARPLPHLFTQLESLLQDERLGDARSSLQNSGHFLSSLQRLARGLEDVDAVLNPTACPEETDLVQIVSETMASLPGLEDRKHVEIRLVAPGRLVGWWDPARLRQVVRVLIEVGGEHGLGSPVDFSLQDLGATARLTVRFHTPSRDSCLNSPVRQPDSGKPAGETVPQSPDDQIALALWPPRETIRQMGGSFDLTTSADARLRITIELPRSATGLAGPATLLH
jgi:hypothetical protein